MSLKNRKKQYDKLKANTLAGKTPGLEQDDGCLVREFGAVSLPTPEKVDPVPLIKGKVLKKHPKNSI